MRFDPLVSTTMMADADCKTTTTTTASNLTEASSGAACVVAGGGGCSVSNQNAFSMSNANHQQMQMQDQQLQQQRQTFKTTATSRELNRLSLTKLKASSLGCQFSNRSRQNRARILSNAPFTQYMEDTDALYQHQIHRHKSLSHQLASSMQDSPTTSHYFDSEMSLDNEYHNKPLHYLTSTSCYHLDADDEIEPIMLIHDDDNEIDLRHFSNFGQFNSSNRQTNQSAPIFLRGCSSLATGTSKKSTTTNSNNNSGQKIISSIASHIISPSTSTSSLESSEISSESPSDDQLDDEEEREDDEDFMTINFSPSKQHYPAVEELKQTLNSCWLCGCNWQQDHISLDCRECGGYALTRPCPKCDGKCKQVWHRNLNASHDHHKALWQGGCGLAGEDSASLPSDNSASIICKDLTNEVQRSPPQNGYNMYLSN